MVGLCLYWHVIGLLPSPLPVDDYYPILCVNHVYRYDADGVPQLSLVQFGGLDVSREWDHPTGTFRWQWWRLVTTQSFHRNEVVFHDGGVLRRVRYGALLITHTDGDAEVKDREFFPVDMRRGLSPP